MTSASNQSDPIQVYLYLILPIPFLMQPLPSQ